MEAFSLERERAVGEIVHSFAGERSELLRNLESQRLATLEWGTAERREAIAEVRGELAGSLRALRGERAVVVDDLRHIVEWSCCAWPYSSSSPSCLRRSSLTRTPVSGRDDGEPES